MDIAIRSLPTTEALRDHVKDVLCGHDRVDPSQAELRQADVERAGRVCGVFFQVRGPRLLRAHALWATDERRVLFYESTGERFAETRLTDAPALPERARQVA
jgi:hypothetical protein